MLPLITATEVEVRLEDLVVCDIRWDLTDASKSRDIYRAGHIPGAVFVDLDHDLAGPPGIEGRHPLPEPAAFARTLGRLGIDPVSQVVVYDDVGGRYAARLWWMLRSIGHEHVQVLDGGLVAWNGPIETGDTPPHATTYPTPDGFAGVVGHTELEKRTVVDARAADRYRGEFEPVDPKAGHIPGAINIPTSANLDESGRFHSPERLKEIYGGLSAEVVTSCGSGVTACHVALAMVRAGFDMPDVYIGSFSEWSRLDLPVSQGSAP